MPWLFNDVMLADFISHQLSFSSRCHGDKCDIIVAIVIDFDVGIIIVPSKARMRVSCYFLLLETLLTIEMGVY